MARTPPRFILTAIDTAEIDPADLAGSWRRTSLDPQPGDPDLDLELVSGFNGELVAAGVAADLGGGLAGYRSLRPERGIWVSSPPGVIRRGVPDGSGELELELEATLSRTLARDAQDDPTSAWRGGRMLRKAASEAYIGRLAGIYADCKDLERQSAAARAQGRGGGGGLELPLHRALHGPNGPPIPRSRRGLQRVIDPNEVQVRLDEDETLTHWDEADRLGVARGSTSKATFRDRKRQQQLLRELDQPRAQDHAARGVVSETPQAAEEAE